MVEVVRIMVTSFKRLHAQTLHSVLDPSSRPPLTHTSTGDSWTLTGKSGSVSCGATAPFSWVLVHTVFVCSLQGSVSPVLYKCRFYGGVYGDLLQEGLCHTQVCCTQGPCPCIRTLLTHTSAGDTQNTQDIAWLLTISPTLYILYS